MTRLRVLFVCGRNQWRSPTAEKIFSRRPELEVRSRGFSAKSSRVLKAADIQWAELIFVMEREHAHRLRSKFRDVLKGKIVSVLQIPDRYRFMDPELVDLLETKAGQILQAYFDSDDPVDDDFF